MKFLRISSGAIQEADDVSAGGLIVVTFTGTLAVGSGNTEFPATRPLTIVGVTPRCTTAPTGADAIFDLNKNGTTMFSTQANRPKVTATNKLGSITVPDVTSVAEGDYLTVDCDQIGSTIAGANAVLAIEYAFTALT